MSRLGARGQRPLWPMELQFCCPSCDKLLQVPARLAGKKVRCTKCEKVVTAPEAEENAKHGVTTSKAKKPKRKQTGRRRKKPGIFATGCAVISALLIVLACVGTGKLGQLGQLAAPKAALTRAELEELFEFEPPPGWVKEYHSTEKGIKGKVQRLRFDVKAPEFPSVKALFIFTREDVSENQVPATIKKAVALMGVNFQGKPSMSVAGMQAQVFELRQKTRITRVYAFFIPESKVLCMIGLGANLTEFDRAVDLFEQSLKKAALHLPKQPATPSEDKP